MPLTDKNVKDINKMNVASQRVPLGDYLENIESRLEYISAGVFEKPSIIDNTNGTITVGSGSYLLYSGSAFNFPLNIYKISGSTFSFVNNSINYVIANYNNGSPIISSSTSRDNINQSSIVPILSVYREGIELHWLDWDEMGKGLSNKISDRLVRTERFTPEIGGLQIGEKTGRYITLTSGKVWYGGANLQLLAVDSQTDSTDFWYHTSGSWTKSVVTTYNNSQYDDGTNLQTLGNNKFGVNWVFRGIENTKHLFTVLGNDSYTFSDAQTSSIPNLPDIINTQCILVGRIIVKKSGSSAASIGSAFSQEFTNAAVNDHNQLNNLQGGSPLYNQFYHLNLNDYTKISGSSYSAKFGDANGNYTVFENDGTMRFSGSATVWDDLVMPLTQTKQGSNLKPDFDYTNIGYLFPQNDVAEILYLQMQIPHSYKLGSDIYPHVHFRQATSASAVFKIDYKWFSIGDPVPAAYTTYIMNRPVASYTSGSLHQIVSGSAPISGSGKGISSVFLAKLYRDDNAVTGDVLTYQFDVHVEKDAEGSSQEYIK